MQYHRNKRWKKRGGDDDFVFMISLFGSEFERYFGDGFPKLVAGIFGIFHGFFAEGGDLEIFFRAAGAFLGRFAVE